MNKSFTMAKLLGVEVAPDGPSLQPTASSLIAKWGQSLAAHVLKTRGSCGTLAKSRRADGGGGGGRSLG